MSTAAVTQYVSPDDPALHVSRARHALAHRRSPILYCLATGLAFYYAASVLDGGSAWAAGPPRASGIRFSGVVFLHRHGVDARGLAPRYGNHGTDKRWLEPRRRLRHQSR